MTVDTLSRSIVSSSKTQSFFLFHHITNLSISLNFTKKKLDLTNCHVNTHLLKLFAKGNVKRSCHQFKYMILITFLTFVGVNPTADLSYAAAQYNSYKDSVAAGVIVRRVWWQKKICFIFQPHHWWWQSDNKGLLQPVDNNKPTWYRWAVINNNEENKARQVANMGEIIC